MDKLNVCITIATTYCLYYNTRPATRKNISAVCVRTLQFCIHIIGKFSEKFLLDLILVWINLFEASRSESILLFLSA